MMKKHLLYTSALMILLSVFGNSVLASDSEAKFKIEIEEALKVWNTATKAANLEQTMTLFDDSEEIMLVGSADGEVSKGKEQIRTWLGQLYGFAGFSLDMTRVDIDSYGTTAWVFMEGKMIVDFHKGGQKVTPYRFIGILVRKKGIWKWRLFDGSVPQSE